MSFSSLLVVGAGTMGGGIAQVAAESGLKVCLYDENFNQIKRTLETINGFLQRKVEKGKLTAQDKEDVIKRIRPIEKLGEEAGICDFAIEAIFENFNAKFELFKVLDKVLNSEATVASNTSTLSITKMSEAFQDPSRFVGMHFFSPVPLMRLVEVIRGEKTSEDTMQKALNMASVLGKTGIVVKDIPGFIVNRFLCLMYNEGARLVEAGVASASDIDTAMKLGANHPMGPLEISDMAGNDIVLAALEALYEMTGNESYKPADILYQMVREGKLGRKSSVGFYDYKK